MAASTIIGISNFVGGLVLAGWFTFNLYKALKSESDERIKAFKRRLNSNTRNKY